MQAKEIICLTQYIINVLYIINMPFRDRTTTDFNYLLDSLKFIVYTICSYVRMSVFEGYVQCIFT